MKQNTKGRAVGKQATRVAGASISALAAMSMLAPMAMAQGAWTPDPHKQVLSSAYQGGDQSDINGLQVFPGQKIEYAVQVDLRIPDNLAYGNNAVKTLAVEDTYDPMFTPDKPSVEFWDARTQKVIPRSVYKLTWNDANHSFVADFDAEWVKANVTPSDKGWLILRFDGTIKSEAKDGQLVKNQAFQIINGVKTATEIPEVKIPSWMPHKEDLNTDLQNIDGKTVVQGDVLLYRLTLDGGPARSKLAYDVHKLGLVDDYDEGYLDLQAKDIQVLVKGTNADVTSKFNIEVKDGKAYIFAKLVDHTNVNGDLIKAVQPTDLAAFDAKAIDPINDAVIDQSLLGQQFFVLLPSKVNKEVDGYVIKNQARQNLENTWKDTEIVSNPLKDIDPVKDVVISEEKQDSINGTEVKLDSIFNYKLTTSQIPANRAYGSKQWSIVDKFNPKYDRFTGNWAIYADSDIWDGQTQIFKKGDLLADFAHHESETYKDFFKVTWDEKSYTFKVEATKKFLDILNTRTDLPQAWAAYVQMERVAPGDKITNVHTETYNEVERPSNEVFTKTFEHPSIKVEKFTLSEGPSKGDRDEPTSPYVISLADQLKGLTDPTAAGVKVGFTVTNTGDVNLKDVKLSDVTDEGATGRIEDLMCTVPMDEATAKALNAGSTKEASNSKPVSGDKIGVLAKGQSIDCVGTMTGMKPGEVHANTATATGKSVFTDKEVKATDPWNAKTEAENPFIDVVKFTLDEGVEKGDRNDPKSPFTIAIEKQVAAHGGDDKSLTKVAFQVTNKGDVPLKDVKLTDLTDSKTKGKVTNIVGVVKGADGKEAEIKGDTIGTLAVGQSVVLVGDLVDMKPDEIHKNTATAEGTSVLSGVKVSDEDPWNANTAPEKPEIDVEKFTLSEGLEKGDRDSAEQAYKLGSKTQASDSGTPNGQPEEPTSTGTPANAHVKVVNGIQITVSSTAEGFTISTKVDPAAAKKPADGKYELTAYGYSTPVGNGAGEFKLTNDKPSVTVKWSEANHSTSNPATETRLSMLPTWNGAPGDDPWTVTVKKADAAAPATPAQPTAPGAEAGAEKTVWKATDKVEVGYKITNKGNVPLKEVVLTDTIVKGSGTVSDLTCTIKGADGKETKVAGDKVANLAVGESVDCIAVVSGILPEELHQNTAKVTAKSALTDKEVTDSDDWFAKAPGNPSIKVEKFTLSEGLKAGDRDTADQALDLAFDKATAKEGIQIGFTVTNTGDTTLKDVKLSDKTTVGNGKVSSLACTVPVKGGEPPHVVNEPQASASPTATPSASPSASASASATPSASATASASPSSSATPNATAPLRSTQTVTGDKIGELAPGQSVECVGTLTISIDQVKEAGKVVLHANTATVEASSKIDGVKVSDTDDWHAKTTVPEKPDTPSKPEPKGTQTGDQLLGNNPGMVAAGLAGLLAALGLGGGWVARNRRRSAAAGVTTTSSDDQE